MLTLEELDLIEKTATAQQNYFMAQNPNVQVPGNYGTDTLRVISELKRRFIDCKLVDKLQSV